MKMKKHAVIFTILLFAVSLATAAYPDTEAGRVLAVKKDVFLVRDNNRENATPRMPLLLKDAVETDEQSRTKLFFTDDSILNLGEKSRVEVEEYIYNAENDRSKSVYRLVDGYLKAVVGKSDLEIHTPTAVVAARGTKFIVSIEKLGAETITHILVLEGKVSTFNIISGVKGSVMVSAGQMNKVASQKPPETVKPIDMKIMEQFTENTMVINDIQVNKENLPAFLPGAEGQGATTADDSQPTIPTTPPVVDVPPQSAFTPVTMNIKFP